MPDPETKTQVAETTAHGVGEPPYPLESPIPTDAINPEKETLEGQTKEGTGIRSAPATNIPVSPFDTPKIPQSQSGMQTSDEAEKYGPPIPSPSPITDDPPKRGPGRPRKIVDLEETIKADPSIPENGVSFFFGEIGLFEFPDKTKYHARVHRAHITDPKLIENLRAFAIKNPTHKVFEDQ